MKIERQWAMPNHNTFSIKPVADLIKRYIAGDWIDPFARNSPFNELCVYTNDLNPDAETTHHMEALEFLTGLNGLQQFDGCLFDPPYSPRQIAECYNQVGRKVHMTDTQSSFYGDRKKAIAPLIRTGGIVISCGWNSGGIGKGLGFDIEEILLVPHGGAHNDTIVTVERKIVSP